MPSSRPRFLVPAAIVALLLGGPLLIPPVRSQGTLPGDQVGDPDSEFALLNGVEVHYKVRGEGSDDLVLLHHTYGNVFTWEHVLSGLADRARVTAFDRPGYGLTQRLPRDQWGETNPYTREASSQITVELMDRLGMDQAVLVGSSAGGTSAIETATRFPERVRALILVSPAITGDVGPPDNLRPLLRAPQLRRIGQRVVERLGSEITAERVGGAWHDPSRVTEQDIANYRRPLDVDNWAVGYYDLFTAEDPPYLVEELRQLQVPTLLVVGGSDTVITVAENRETAEAIPGARFEVLEGCGHTPQEECPDQLLTLIRGFLDGLA